MSIRVGNGLGGTGLASVDTDRARVFTSLVMAESRSPARSPLAASGWSGILGGKPIQANPVGPRAANGNQLWQVKWSPDAKSSVQVETSLREQFGPQHIQPGTPVRRALDAQLSANQSGPKAWSSSNGFMGLAAEAKPQRRIPGTDKHVWEVSVKPAQTQGGSLSAMMQKPVTANYVTEGDFDPAVLTSDSPLARELKGKLGIA